jgi:hypothetical protein
MKQQPVSSGAEVKVIHAGSGEQGAWKVVAQARSRDPGDPAWEVRHVNNGRTRFFHQSRLRVVREARTQ